MTRGEGHVATTRARLLPGLIAGVVGIVAAALLGLSLGDGGGAVAVNPSSSTTAFQSVGPSLIETPVASVAAPSESSLPPASTPVVTPVATIVATSVPTPTSTRAPTPAPTKAPRPTPTPNTDPAIVSFTVPATEDCTDDTAGTAHVSWTIARAAGASLSIDGPGIFDSYPGASQSMDVPFACSHQQLSHTYTLTTMGGTGPAATSTKTVTAAPPKINTFSLGAANCPSGDPGSVGIALTYAISAATGVELKRDGAIYATYSGTTASNGLTVAYDCSKASQTFVLTTTGGFGSEATKQLVVQRSLP